VFTHFIVSADVGRSRRFYADVLAGETVRSGEPSCVALANGFIILVGELRQPRLVWLDQ